MAESDHATLHLWPAGYHPDGITLDVEQAKLALDRYHTVAAQGPDYFAAAASRQHEAPDTIEFGHLAWAVLLAGQPRPIAAQSLLAAPPIGISHLPSKVALEDLDADSDTLIALGETIWALRALPGFGVAIATKVLHPLRPRLAPVIDRQSFFGTYFNERWTLGDPPAKRDARHVADVVSALQAVHRVVAAAENARAWAVLDGWVDPDGRGPFTRIQVFDMLWWTLWQRPGEFAWTGVRSRTRFQG